MDTGCGSSLVLTFERCSEGLIAVVTQPTVLEIMEGLKFVGTYVPTKILLVRLLGFLGACQMP